MALAANQLKVLKNYKSCLAQEVIIPQSLHSLICFDFNLTLVLLFLYLSRDIRQHIRKHVLISSLLRRSRPFEHNAWHSKKPPTAPSKTYRPANKIFVRATSNGTTYYHTIDGSWTRYRKLIPMFWQPSRVTNAIISISIIIINTPLMLLPVLTPADRLLLYLHPPRLIPIPILRLNLIPIPIPRLNRPLPLLLRIPILTQSPT